MRGKVRREVGQVSLDGGRVFSKFGGGRGMILAVGEIILAAGKMIPAAERTFLLGDASAAVLEAW